jgi:hypothetical protein
MVADLQGCAFLGPAISFEDDCEDLDGLNKNEFLRFQVDLQAIQSGNIIRNSPDREMFLMTCPLNLK